MDQIIPQSETNPESSQRYDWESGNDLDERAD